MCIRDRHTFKNKYNRWLGCIPKLVGKKIYSTLFSFEESYKLKGKRRLLSVFYWNYFNCYFFDKELPYPFGLNKHNATDFLIRCRLNYVRLFDLIHGLVTSPALLVKSKFRMVYYHYLVLWIQQFAYCIITSPGAGFYNWFVLIPIKERLSIPFSCLLYTSPSPRDLSTSRMPSSA